MIQNPLAASMVQKPMQSVALNMSPQLALPEPPKNALMQAIGGGLNAFRKSFDPEGYKADKDEAKAAEGEKLKQTLALMQQQRALPEQQRGQWWQQNAPMISKIIGQDVSQMPLDVTKFSDQALDGQIAALSAQMGIGPAAPEPMTAYQQAQIELQRQQAAQPKPFNLGDGAFVEYDPQADENERLRMLREPTAKPANLPEGMWMGPDGKGPPQPIPGYVDMRARIAAAGRAPTEGSATYRPATPEEKAAYGLPPEAAAKVNTRTNEIEIIPGGAPKPTPMQLAVDKEFASDLVEWQTQGSTNFLKNVRQLDAAIKRLESGEELSGPASGMAGRDIWGQPGRAVQQQVEEVIQSSLREVLGAQFTQKEGEGILARTYDPMQEEKINAQRVRALVARLKLAAQQKNAAMEYYNQNGTMVGYKGKIPTIADFEDAASSSSAPPKTRYGVPELLAKPKPAAQVPEGVDPEDWKYMPEDKKALFQ